MIDISGSYLMANGWQRKGSTYTKGEDVIVYDGCEWFLNGRSIIDLQKLIDGLCNNYNEQVKNTENDNIIY